MAQVKNTKNAVIPSLGDMKFSSKIKKVARSFFDELDKSDFSHGFTHIQRVLTFCLVIGKKENADLEILEAAALLHDIARSKEDTGEVEDHAKESAFMANKILADIGFPKEKIQNVFHSISVHRCKGEPPQTLEAKILQDADRLDALGAIDIARVLGSTFQSKKYNRPVYVDEPYSGDSDGNKSAIHYIIYKTVHPKRKPENFNTETGRKIAEERFKFSLEFIDRFIKEWHGEL